MRVREAAVAVGVLLMVYWMLAQWRESSSIIRDLMKQNAEIKYAAEQRLKWLSAQVEEMEERLGAPAQGGAPREDRPLRMLWFSMDSRPGYPPHMGESVVRSAFTAALSELGHSVKVCPSDEAFDAECASPRWDAVFVDPFTAGGVRNPPRACLAQRRFRGVYVVGYFGWYRRLGSFPIPMSHYLSAFPTPDNTWLGFPMESTAEGDKALAKKAQGVLWGKSMNYYTGRVRKLLSDVHAETGVPMFTPAELRGVNGVTSTGLLSREDWASLMCSSRFVLGFGDPVLGPTPMKATACGTMVIIPRFEPPRVLQDFNGERPMTSQHQPLADEIPSHVCLYTNTEEAVACVKKALATDLPPAQCQGIHAAGVQEARRAHRERPPPPRAQ